MSPPLLRRHTHLTQRPQPDGLWRGRFDAMASPCEVLVETADRSEAARALEICAAEAWRIEQKFSRYRDDSVVHTIHETRGTDLEVDLETADLLDFADRCHSLSGGLFDVTSGVLRSVWHFDGSDRIPSPEQVAAVLPRIGWNRVRWQRPVLHLPAGMELDLGGIGKEYAVDRALDLAQNACGSPLLVNFGGDLRAGRSRSDGRTWQVGIEDPATDGRAASVLELSCGALATSGDSRRVLVREGIRYGHILDPRTGWPVEDAPRSVTVVASTCVEAGMLASFAMLRGAGAEAFLQAEGVRGWCIR